MNQINQEHFAREVCGVLHQMGPVSTPDVVRVVLSLMDGVRLLAHTEAEELTIVRDLGHPAYRALGLMAQRAIDEAASRLHGKLSISTGVAP